LPTGRGFEFTAINISKLWLLFSADTVNETLGIWAGATDSEENRTSC